MPAPETNAQRQGRQMRDRRRHHLFLSQQELAELIVKLAADAGVELTLDQSNVSRWEHGQTSPSLRHRRFVAQALEVPADLLFQELPEQWVTA